MLSRLFRWVAALLLVCSLSLPFAAGQGSSLPTVERGVSTDEAAQSEKSGSSQSALPYFILAIYSMLVLTIVCMPSRKA